MVSPLDAARPQHVTAAFVIIALQNCIRCGLLDVTTVFIKHLVAGSTTEHGTKCDPSWIEPVIRDFIERGYLTVLRSPHRSGIVGTSTTRLDDMNFDKMRLRINSSILHANAIPESPQLVNNNHGEQFFGHASKFEENHLGNTPAVSPVDAQSPAADTPKKLLFGWAEILNTLKLSNDDTNRDRVSRLNDLHAGPIIKRGHGQPPMVDADKLVPWWNSLETRHAESVQHATDTEATVAASYRHGTDGEVVPDIGGHVQKRRKRS
jgi:hypothetical protein